MREIRGLWRDQVVGRQSLDFLFAPYRFLNKPVFVRETVLEDRRLETSDGGFLGPSISMRELLGAIWGEGPRRINSPEQPPKFRADVEIISHPFSVSREIFASFQHLLSRWAVVFLTDFALLS